MKRDGVLVFHSIHKVMHAEKLLKGAGFDVRLMPIPRELSSDCGLSLCFVFACHRQIDEILVADGCPAAEIHRWGNGHYERVI